MYPAERYVCSCGKPKSPIARVCIACYRGYALEPKPARPVKQRLCACGAPMTRKALTCRACLYRDRAAKKKAKAAVVVRYCACGRRTNMGNEVCFRCRVATKAYTPPSRTRPAPATGTIRLAATPVVDTGPKCGCGARIPSTWKRCVDCRKQADAELVVPPAPLRFGMRSGICPGCGIRPLTEGFACICGWTGCLKAAA